MEQNRDRYTTTVVAGSREFTKLETAMLSDVSDAVKLDEAVTPETGLVISIGMFAVLEIHNPRAKDDENTDYTALVIEDADTGERYTSGSSSLIERITELWDDLSEEDPNSWALKIYKRESKNYRGKYFLTARPVAK